MKQGHEFITNPGSSEAIESGCLCPLMDNARGLGIPGSTGSSNEPLYWINQGCPLHDAEKINMEASAQE